MFPDNSYSMLMLNWLIFKLTKIFKKVNFLKFFLGLFESAIEEHKKELHLSESINDIIAVAISHRKIGECLCECKDFKNALLHQQKYLEV